MIKIITMFMFFCIPLFGDSIVIEEGVNHDVSDILLQGLYSYNIPYLHHSDYEPFVIYAKDSEQKIIGGLCGYVMAKRAVVDYAWVDETRRSEGIGTKLFLELEGFAKSKDYSCIQLYTYTFQAPCFYEKLGYEKIGVIKDWVAGYDSIFYRKNL